MRTGIFGGTFDPPHTGHLVLAAEALDQLALERVLWVLTPNPPHKLRQDIRAVNERRQMVEAAIAGEPRFILSRVEMDRPGPHYAADTVHRLHAARPEDDLFYIMGEDSLRDLPLWRQPQALLRDLAGLGVMRRANVTIDLISLETSLPGISPMIHYFTTPLIEISSSDIRRRMVEGRPYRYFVPAAVYELLKLPTER